MIIGQTLARFRGEQQVEACEVIARSRDQSSLDRTVVFFDREPFITEEPDLFVCLHILVIVIVKLITVYEGGPREGLG